MPQIMKREFNLIGGKPLNTYWATTGSSTQSFLNTIWAEQNKEENKDKIISIGILTANWFCCGMGYKNISICAKGEGHLEFKENVEENCHYIVLMSPLGKLLPQENETLLNELIPKDPEEQYDSFIVQSVGKDKTCLLTSLRPETNQSPIVGTSIHLTNIQKMNAETNYTLFEDCPVWEPKGDDPQVIVTELPHEYIRINFTKVYHVKDERLR
jgi:hypothetical protein